MLTLGGCDAETATVELGVEVEQWSGEGNDAINEPHEDHYEVDDPLVYAIIADSVHEVGVVVGLWLFGTVI